MGYTRLHLHFSDINATGTHACNQPTPVRLSLCEINVTAVLVASRITPITHRPPREDLHTRLGGLNTQHENIRFVAPDCTSEFNTRVLRALPTLEQAILLAYNVRTRRRRPTPVLCANATACPPDHTKISHTDFALEARRPQEHQSNERTAIIARTTDRTRPARLPHPCK